MKNIVVFLFALISSFSVTAQTVFFKSNQSFEEKSLSQFYASITSNDSTLLFNAPDYKLYAYDKQSGRLKWDYYLRRQSDNPPYFVNGSIWANGNDEVVQLNPSTGEKIKTLSPFLRIESAPIFKNGVVYGTAITDIGSLFAYDPKSDSILWQRFIAHGCSLTPYYQSDKIIANAEGNYWIEVNYDGQLKPQCEDSSMEEEQVFPSELPCAKNFFAVTHDGRTITESLAGKMDFDSYERPEIFLGEKNTFILNNEELFVIGNKLKLKSRIELSTMSDTIDFNYSSLSKIFYADSETVCILHGDYLLKLDYKKKRLIKAWSLKEWEPHAALLDGNQLWMVSNKDGLLYGLSID